LGKKGKKEAKFRTEVIIQRRFAFNWKREIKTSPWGAKGGDIKNRELDRVRRKRERGGKRSLRTFWGVMGPDQTFDEHHRKTWGKEDSRRGGKRIQEGVKRDRHCLIRKSVSPLPCKTGKKVRASWKGGERKYKSSSKIDQERAGKGPLNANRGWTYS